MLFYTQLKVSKKSGGGIRTYVIVGIYNLFRIFWAHAIISEQDAIWCQIWNAVLCHWVMQTGLIGQEYESLTPHKLFRAIDASTMLIISKYFFIITWSFVIIQYKVIELGNT